MEIDRNSMICKMDEVELGHIDNSRKDFRTILLLRYPKDRIRDRPTFPANIPFSY